MSIVEQANDSNIKQLLEQKGKPIFVYVGAQWCAKCPEAWEVVKQFEALRPDIQVIKVDIGEAMNFASEYRVFKVPKFFIFKDGEMKFVSGGSSSSAEELVQILKEVEGDF